MIDANHTAIDTDVSVDGAVILVDQVMPSGPPPATPRAHVGVVAPLNFPDMTAEIAVLVRELVHTTLRSLWELEATFDLIDPSAQLDGGGVPEGCDGLLLLGGGDIDPSCYTTSPAAAPGTYGVDVRADHQSFALLEQAERDELPILGVCRGHQLLNVLRGGTIIPDLDDPQHLHHGPPHDLFVTETITLLPDTRVHNIFDADRVTSFAAHHQAVDQLGSGLVISARAADGVVEAIEDPSRWIVGIQWHPERASASAEDRRKLFGAFVDACATRHSTEPVPSIPA